MLGQISSKELTEWTAFFALEPLGEREDHRAGLVTSAIYNVNRTKRGQKTWKPEDFFKRVAATNGELDQDELRSRIDATFRHIAAVKNSSQPKAP